MGGFRLAAVMLVASILPLLQLSILPAFPGWIALLPLPLLALVVVLDRGYIRGALAVTAGILLMLFLVRPSAWPLIGALLGGSIALALTAQYIFARRSLLAFTAMTAVGVLTFLSLLALMTWDAAVLAALLPVVIASSLIALCARLFARTLYATLWSPPR